MKLTGNVSVSVENNKTEEVLEELKRKVSLALEGIGGEAEKYAKANCPVDTGRLRNSITFVTKEKQGWSNMDSGAMAEPADYKPHSSPEENAMYVGTNVEYAAEQEYYGRKKHYLRNSVTMHSDEYKKIAENAFKTE
jgi:hypothetical protein